MNRFDGSGGRTVDRYVVAAVMPQGGSAGAGGQSVSRPATESEKQAQLRRQTTRPPTPSLGLDVGTRINAAPTDRLPEWVAC